MILNEVYVSDLVMQEIDRCPEPKRSELGKFMKEILYKEILVDQEAVELANQYISAGIIPIKYEEDALHIAIASTQNCNAIISWNFQHMVKLKTIIGVNGINSVHGYKSIEIVTPFSIIEEDLL
ncbi:MAG: PIN domain nuclease [Oligoflexia bacterium]|nr:PIN domain nuclease [Oligoflexia bacterium]MBF0366160.1 PIN domain nuclease [Oligoflexia bacterium]